MIYPRNEQRLALENMLNIA